MIKKLQKYIKSEVIDNLSIKRSTFIGTSKILHSFLFVIPHSIFTNDKQLPQRAFHFEQGP